MLRIWKRTYKCFVIGGKRHLFQALNHQDINIYLHFQPQIWYHKHVFVSLSLSLSLRHLFQWKANVFSYIRFLNHIKCPLPSSLWQVQKPKQPLWKTEYLIAKKKTKPMYIISLQGDLIIASKARSSAYRWNDFDLQRISLIYWKFLDFLFRHSVFHSVIISLRGGSVLKTGGMWKARVKLQMAPLLFPMRWKH